MATRCNIRIESGSTVIYVYRHWDGYPSMTGADLAEKLIALRGRGDVPTAFLAALLNDRHEKADYQKEASPVYELTTGVHGDIEWAYSITFGREWVEIGAAPRRLSSDETPEGAMARARSAAFTLEKFIRVLVNPDIEDGNRRLAELQKAHPTSVYKDCAPQALLEVPA